MTDATSLFFYGTLRFPPLLEAILGRAIETSEAQVSGYEVRIAAEAGHPVLHVVEDGVAVGRFAQDLTPQDLERLAYYEAEYGYELRPVRVENDGTIHLAQVWYPVEGVAVSDTPWSYEDWVADWGDVTTLAALEVMRHYGAVSAGDMKASYPQILSRAASSIRAAADPAPVTLRRETARDAVEIEDERRPYLGYFGIGECDLRFPLYDGGQSPLVKRAAFLSADAVTVLPYDPKRDRVLLIEQFRFGPYLRGDPYPWALEPIAGRIDAGETPEEAARRETVEEAGLTLKTLHEVGRYYPSPGAVAEWLVSYVGIADLPDSVAGIGGLESEAEDILSHVIGFKWLMSLVESGEVAVGPLILSAQWLALNRDRLRSDS